jgi:hypothetical protein
MKMKTKYFFVLMVAVLMGTQVMNAQNETNKRTDKRMRPRMTMEQLADKQAAKIVTDLGLDDKTAAKFTEVYKKYMKELDDVRKEFPLYGVKGMKAKAQASIPTDEEVDKMMRDRFKQSRKMLEVREKYYDEFRKFLSPKQVQKVYDHGQMNRNLFHQEMNRRAGMKHERGGGHPHQGRAAQQK